MSTIIFTAGAKGGTGKSTATRFIITYLREKGFKPFLLDMDDESRTLSRFFPEAQRIDMKEPFSHNVLIKKVIAGEKLVVADLKGGTGGDTLEWWLDVPFEELPDINFICLASITTSPDSVQSFLSWAAALQDQVSYIVCKNQKDGATFPDYEASGEAIYFKNKFKPLHVLIPNLHELYTTELERLNLTIAEVLEAAGSDSINGKAIGDILPGILERAHLRRFQRNIYDQFEPVIKLLNV